jgi:hypothetical protein
MNWNRFGKAAAVSLGVLAAIVALFAVSAWISLAVIGDEREAAAAAPLFMLVIGLALIAGWAWYTHDA